MNENNRNWIAFQVECERRARISYRLRFAVFAASMLVVAAAVWAAVAYGGETVLRYEAREQERLQAEYEGLQEAYDAEMVEGELRAARLRDNGEPVAAAAWRIASGAPAIRKGDAE